MLTLSIKRILVYTFILIKPVYRLDCHLGQWVSGSIVTHLQCIYSQPAASCGLIAFWKVCMFVSFTVHTCNWNSIVAVMSSGYKKFDMCIPWDSCRLVNNYRLIIDCLCYSLHTAFRNLNRYRIKVIGYHSHVKSWYVIGYITESSGTKVILMTSVTSLMK